MSSHAYLSYVFTSSQVLCLVPSIAREVHAARNKFLLHPTSNTQFQCLRQKIISCVPSGEDLLGASDLTLFCDFSTGMLKWFKQKWENILCKDDSALNYFFWVPPCQKMFASQRENGSQHHTLQEPQVFLSSTSFPGLHWRADVYGSPQNVHSQDIVIWELTLAKVSRVLCMTPWGEEARDVSFILQYNASKLLLDHRPHLPWIQTPPPVKHRDGQMHEFPAFHSHNHWHEKLFWLAKVVLTKVSWFVTSFLPVCQCFLSCNSRREMSVFPEFSEKLSA